LLFHSRKVEPSFSPSSSIPLEGVFYKSNPRKCFFSLLMSRLRGYFPSPCFSPPQPFTDSACSLVPIFLRLQKRSFPFLAQIVLRHFTRRLLPSCPVVTRVFSLRDFDLIYYFRDSVPVSSLRSTTKLGRPSKAYRYLKDSPRRQQLRFFSKFEIVFRLEQILSP